MAIQEIKKEDWCSCFSRLHNEKKCHRVQIEAISKEMGDQLNAEWDQLEEIAYDAGRDEVEIVTPTIGHLIKKPKELFIDDNLNGDTVIEVISEQDVKYIISLREAPAIEDKYTSAS